MPTDRSGRVKAAPVLDSGALRARNQARMVGVVSDVNAQGGPRPGARSAKMDTIGC